MSTSPPLFLLLISTSFHAKLHYGYFENKLAGTFSKILLNQGRFLAPYEHVPRYGLEA